MATIFLSYRRTDSPQACRVYDWLTRRFGYDAIFMDVADIPFAIRFTDYIKQEIAQSSILIALIGDKWQEKLERAEDPVLMEIETALTNNVPVLPVLIGTTPMPNAETLPPSIASIAYQNASTVGVSRDFDTHMQALVPKIEAILAALSRESVVTADPDVVRRACGVILNYLERNIPGGEGSRPTWKVISTRELSAPNYAPNFGVTLCLHRVQRLAELLELHFILTIWTFMSDAEHSLAGHLMSQFEQTPVIPSDFIRGGGAEAGWELKIRNSDEDARQIWRTITDQPLLLSLAYIATVSPKPAEQTPEEPQ